MGDMESYKVMLNGPAPWGFRLQGGKDFSMPLSISRLTPGGKAAQAGVGVGDWVLYIDGESTSAMTHIEAQNRIRACGDRLCLTLSRAQNQLGKPQKVLSLDKQPPQLLESPSTPVCDPVKLRMLEDIDDSKPHSWTSQSRSFRKLSRLVGTNSMEDGEDELVKKPSHSREALCPVAVSSLPLQESSCWWSCRAHSALTPQWAPPELSHWSGHHLGRVLPGRPPAGQDVLCRVGPAGHCWHQPGEAKLCHCFLRKRDLEKAGALTTPCWGYWEVLGSNWTMCREPGMGLRDGRAELGECCQLLLVLECICEGWAEPWSNTECCATIFSNITGMPVGPAGAQWSSVEDGEDEIVKKPRQPPQLLEPPSDTVCDPVKLRMLEDIDDSKPHTWTSQSRSFRKLARLVGANSMDDGEDEPVTKPRLELFPELHNRHCQRSATALTITSGGSCPKNPPGDSHGSSWGTVEQRQPLESPSTPGCDPGKLRMLEDAEGWQPRTGTSQSRSFRKLAQLTGTDGMEDGEDETVKKPRDARGSSWGTVEQRQPPQPLEPPSTPGCNPGKLRLIEDAEDWQPRTGTSQSRTFRKLAQLTGTDSSMEDHDDVFVRKPSQVSVPDPSPGATMKTEPGLAPRTPSATPGPTSRPPWAVDPSFAERYAPDKTSTVVSKHSQPATPTPMQNRSSIVQAAQQAPEGPGRTPLCYKCNKVIRGRYLVALGHYYHPEEFTCCQCRKVLDEGGFFEEKGSIFCPKCYDTRYAPSCAKCKKKITGEVMHALKMTWHVQCFTCNACKTPIRNRAFYMEEGQPYCERDYEKMFGTKCRGCDFKIDAGDRFLEALGFSWHDTCFVCAICQTNLEGKTFYSKKDKPLCKSHAFSHV
ncbi:PDZ and LIM domain protein 7 isoform X2 [Corvus hawaiiensis]|uniref:PDZ and LIM domain protein 7 isoform X2 n=1 Tax=Corvus hawaiiensis TaxID=134902 RepID=UPI0020191CB3|nr:PDZ and LIM domain protein 7 isoform X2 [Corvus hawaiiensis]